MSRVSTCVTHYSFTSPAAKNQGFASVLQDASSHDLKVACGVRKQREGKVGSISDSLSLSPYEACVGQHTSYTRRTLRIAGEGLRRRYAVMKDAAAAHKPWRILIPTAVRSKEIKNQLET